MKCVFASKYYYRRGGLQSYFFKTKELLEQKGHEVILFLLILIEAISVHLARRCGYQSFK